MTFDRFEPIGWAIFRGVIAAYSCIGLVTFATYAIYTQVQLSSNQAYTLQESIIPFKQCADVVGSTTTYVTAFQIVSMPHLLRILKISSGQSSHRTIASTLISIETDSRRSPPQKIISILRGTGDGGIIRAITVRPRVSTFNGPAMTL